MLSLLHFVPHDHSALHVLFPLSECPSSFAWWAPNHPSWSSQAPSPQWNLPDLPELITLSSVLSWYFEHNIYRAQEKSQMEAYIPHVQMFKKL